MGIEMDMSAGGPRLPRVGTSTTADAGIGFVKTRVTMARSDNGLGCLFRELPTADIGLDGQIEITADFDGASVATGKIISAQVKTGPSYFRHDSGETWAVYMDESTVNYWNSHSVPVLLILVDLTRDECYWVRGDAEHHRTETGYRIEVPKMNALNGQAYRALAEMAENATEAGRRLARLEADRSIMQAIHDGESIAVGVGHWWNKSSGRCDVTVGYALEDPYEGDPRGMKVIERWGARGDGSADAVMDWFPWAEAVVDEEFYESISDDLYDEYLSETGTYDSETGQMFDSHGNFETWLEKRRGLADAPPYDNVAGEIGYYRYRIVLNDLGRAALLVHSHLSGDN